MDIINFVKDNWVNILAIIGGIDIILGVIVKWTPVNWDDQVYTILHSWISQILGKGK
jgi:hypothetical protein